MSWPGVAGVDVALVHIFNGTWAGGANLAGTHVDSISSYLSADQTTARPYRLALPWYGTKGTYVHGKGFVLSKEQYAAALNADPRNAECLNPYLVAQDFTSDYMQRASRWVINFSNMDENEARKYPILFDHLVKTVKPKRDAIKGQVHERCFWKHWDRRDELYESLSELQFAIVCPEVSKHCCFEFVPTNMLFSHMVNVIACDRVELLALLQSEFHVQWAWQHGSTMRNAGIRYTTKDCFNTFPPPLDISNLLNPGSAFHALRKTIMNNRKEGLTRIYNRLNDQTETSGDIASLRRLHVEMDQAVAVAYGWQNFDLDHGFHKTKQGIRYTISEVARREVLDRLLALNHQRHSEEEAEAVSQVADAPTKRGRKKKDTGGQATLEL